MRYLQTISLLSSWKTPDSCAAIYATKRGRVLDPLLLVNQVNVICLWITSRSAAVEKFLTQIHVLLTLYFKIFMRLNKNMQTTIC